MSIHNILKNSSKFLTVLTLSTSLFLSITTLASAKPFLADNHNDVVVSTECDLAVRFKKNESLLSWTYIPNGDIRFHGGGIPGVGLYSEIDLRRFDIYCINMSFSGLQWSDLILSNQYVYYLEANGNDLVNFTPESKELIGNNIKKKYDSSNNSFLGYVFKKGNIFYNLDFWGEGYTKYSFADLQVQFNSLAPSNPSITYCFPDVQYNHTFNTYICNLKKDRVIGGYPDGTYQPESLVSRAAMAKFIKNGFKIPTNTSCGDFSDVPKSHPFYTHITSLKCAGVIGGFPDGTYKPESFVDRGSMSKFIVNGSGLSLGGSCSQFSDVNISHPFAPYIRTLKCRNIIGGYPDGTYQPEAQVSRGAMAKFIDNAR